jgi:uncharacterized protein
MRIINVLLISLTVLFSSFSLAVEHAGISVSGKATINKAPDQFLIRLSIVERGISAAKAKQRVDLKAQQVIKSIRTFGIEDNALKTTQLRINPIYPHNKVSVDKVYAPIGSVGNGKVVSVNAKDSSNEQVQIEFDVSRDIDVMITDFAMYEKLLDKVTKLGVTRISPAQASISDADSLYQRALLLAVTNASEKAQKLAKTLGVKLGQVSKLEELSYRAPGTIQMAADSLASGGRLQSHAGFNEVSAEVRITFSISPQ